MVVHVLGHAVEQPPSRTSAGGIQRALATTVVERVHGLDRLFVDYGAIPALAWIREHAAKQPLDGIRIHRAIHQRLHPDAKTVRSEEHTSELQSLMRISYAVFCLKKKKKNKQITPVR